MVFNRDAIQILVIHSQTYAMTEALFADLDHKLVKILPPKYSEVDLAGLIRDAISTC